MSSAYFILKKFCVAVKSLYFKDVHIIGLENIPLDGPLIICGNHANQFIDPIMIGSTANRHISFTIAASSFSKPVVGSMARAVKALPVKRAEDSKIKASGKIKFGSESQIKGINTKFIEETKSLGQGWSLLIKSKIVPVKKVIDAETLEIAANPEFSELVNGGEFNFFYLPKTDNSSLFDEAYNILENDGCLCIFPEGTSHDRPDFIKLKAGIALMALGAMSERKSKNVRIVPVGLNYFNREKFRSEVILEYGRPFEIPSEWAEEYKTNKRLVTEKLLNEIEIRMKAVTLTGDSYHDLRTLHLFRQIYVPKDVKLSPTQYSELCKRFANGVKKMKEYEDCKVLTVRANAYMKELDEIALEDLEVRDTSFEQKKMKRKFILSFFLLILYLLVFTPGVLILIPFIYYVKKVSEKERVLAKEKNPNKIAGLDVVSSVKVFKFVACIPFIYLLWVIYYCFFAQFWLWWMQSIMFEGLLARFTVGTIMFPVYFYTCIIAYDYFQSSLKTFYSRTLFFILPDKLNRLKKDREEICLIMKDLINKHIQESDPDAAKDRIIKEDQVVDVNKDSVQYLNRRFSERRGTNPELMKELELVTQNQ